MKHNICAWIHDTQCLVSMIEDTFVCMVSMIQNIYVRCPWYTIFGVWYIWCTIFVTSIHDTKYLCHVFVMHNIYI